MSLCRKTRIFSRMTFGVSKECLNGLQDKKKGTYKKQNQRQKKKEHKSTAWALQDEIRKAKAQLEIRLAGNIKGEIGFNTYAKLKRKHGAFEESKRS